MGPGDRGVFDTTCDRDDDDGSLDQRRPFEGYHYDVLIGQNVVQLSIDDYHYTNHLLKWLVVGYCSRATLLWLVTPRFITLFDHGRRWSKLDGKEVESSVCLEMARSVFLLNVS